MEDPNLITDGVVQRRISIPMKSIGKNLDETILDVARTQYEGKCIQEGFVMPGTVSIAARDAGLVDGCLVHFTLGIACSLCLPVEGMKIACVAKTVTDTAGVRAELATKPSPLVIYLARDHHYLREDYNSIAQNANIVVRVIGQRYELNDPYISVIAELVSA